MEIGAETRYANKQIPVLLWLLLGVNKRVPIGNHELDVHRTLCEICIQEVDEVVAALFARDGIDTELHVDQCTAPSLRVVKFADGSGQRGGAVSVAVRDSRAGGVDIGRDRFVMLTTVGSCANSHAEDQVNDLRERAGLDLVDAA